MNLSCGFGICVKFLGLKPEDLRQVLNAKLGEDVTIAKIQMVLRGTVHVPDGWWDALRGFWADCKDIAHNLIYDHQQEPDSSWCMCFSDNYPPYLRLPLCLAMLEISGDDGVSVLIDRVSETQA